MQTVFKCWENSCAGAYRYGFNGQEKSTEINGSENLYTAEFWEYDSRTGRRWNVDPRPNISMSPYSTFANNPIWNYDKKGDSIILGDEPHIQVETAYRMLWKIVSGAKLLNSYISNFDEHIYLGVFSTKGPAAGQTIANISTSQYVDKNGDFNEDKFNDRHSSQSVKDLINWFSNSQKFQKGGTKTHLVALNIEGNRNVGKFDKYDLMFIIYHEIEGHVKGSTGDPDTDHSDFGNKYTPLPGMLLKHNNIVGTIVQPGTKAWNAFEEILALKIKNKDASKQNIADYEYMKTIDKGAAASATKTKTKSP